MLSDIDTTTRDAHLQKTRVMDVTQRQMPLDFDSLVAVMPWISERRDLLSFISTCVYLYSAGVPVLLRFRCNIGTKNLPSFKRFLNAKAPSSFLGLRDLFFSFSQFFDDVKMKPGTVDSLTSILSRAKNLERIKISDDGELYQDPALFETLASCSSLRHLILNTEDVNPRLVAMLEQLQAPLTVLQFGGGGENLFMATTLVNFANTLEELTISSYTLCQTLEAGPVYSQLVHLELLAIGNPLLSILMPAFPRLQTLSIQFTLDDPMALRDTNLQFQVDHPSHQWLLSSLIGDARSLYSLALQTTVPKVEITSFSSHLLHELQDCLSPIRPMQLYMDNLEDPTCHPEWISTGILDGWEELTRLDLVFMFPSKHGSDMDPTHQERLELFFAELAVVSTSEHSLKMLSIYFGAVDSDDDMRESGFLTSLEPRALAARAIQTIPTLELIRLKTRWRESYWAYKEGELELIMSEGELVFDKATAEVMASLEQAYTEQ